jgi:pimeloyl-ACP methyl ester carboxylesterase
MSVRVTSSNPTVVLVHGAFADASSWARVTAACQAIGLTVVAAANPLRGVANDAAYIASVASQIEGPVLLVGHSYGGTVITVAGASARNVVGLVYVAAWIPEEGDRAAAHGDGHPETLFGAAARTSAFPRPGDGDAGTEVHLDPGLFAAAFADDLPGEETAILAASQRPLSLAAVEEPALAAAWHDLPAWALVATADRMIHPDVQRELAERAGAQVTEVDASHAIALSRPAEVTAVIVAAATALATPPAATSAA